MIFPRFLWITFKHPCGRSFVRMRGALDFFNWNTKWLCMKHSLCPTNSGHVVIKPACFFFYSSACHKQMNIVEHPWKMKQVTPIETTFRNNFSLILWFWSYTWYGCSKSLTSAIFACVNVLNIYLSYINSRGWFEYLTWLILPHEDVLKCFTWAV